MMIKPPKSQLPEDVDAGSSSYTKVDKQKLPGSTSAWYLHPLLFLTFPIVSLYASNAAGLEFDLVLRSLFITLLLVVAMLFILTLLLKDVGKSSLLLTAGLILFFAYGHIYRISRSLEILGESVGRHRYLLPLTILCFLVWSYWVLRRIGSQAIFHHFFNLTGFVLLILPVIEIGWLTIRQIKLVGFQGSAPIAAIEDIPGNSRPDVYYIVLDGYGREDVLLDLYDFDNSSFLGSLEELGFYVADESRSNYTQTMLSLASSLNMKYLEEFKGWETRPRDDTVVFKEWIKDSTVLNTFESLGYETIAFETGYGATNIRDADIYLSVEKSSQAGRKFMISINPFEDMLLESSMAVLLRDLQVKTGVLDQYLVEDPFSRHRRRVHFILDTLGEIPAWGGDYFVFAHIISPHAPFVFDEFGGVIAQESAFTLADWNITLGREVYIQLYRQQVIYLNTLVANTVRQILDTSTTEPIIILQSDHGPAAYFDDDSMMDSDPRERLSILNAIHLPGDGERLLYPSISPVNTFRMIFNEYFDFSYTSLEDKSFFSTLRRPFNFIDVTKVLLE